MDAAAVEVDDTPVSMDYRSMHAGDTFSAVADLHIFKATSWNKLIMLFEGQPYERKGTSVEAFAKLRKR